VNNTIILDNTVRVHIARGDAHTKMTSDTHTASYERIVRRPMVLSRATENWLSDGRAWVRREIKERKRGRMKKRERGREKNGWRKKKLSGRSQYAYAKSAAWPRAKRRRVSIYLGVRVHSYPKDSKRHARKY